MAALPSLSGAAHSSRMVSLPRAVAVRPVGGSGATGSPVVAEAVSEGAEVPTPLIAETR